MFTMHAEAHRSGLLQKHNCPIWCGMSPCTVMHTPWLSKEEAHRDSGGSTPPTYTQTHTIHTTHTHTEWSMAATVASHELSPNHDVLETMLDLVSHNVYGN